ncbi:MAG: LPS-assembly protein LptD, partial [Treponema sp.]|nr:LPS-assembly protein LptD [Treponema sp.]
MSIPFRRQFCITLLCVLPLPAVLPELSAQEAAPWETALEEAADTPETVAGETATEETPEETGIPAVRAPTREEEILELDINTSTLSELAAWVRSLGLSEGGDRAALGNRLREYYKLAEAVPAGVAAEGDAIPKVITIESARSTEYFTIDAVDEDYARLRGDVVISLKDGDSVHRIKAWELLYNRSRNLLSATGGVEYVKESGDTIETFRGESITVDLDNWSSIFMDGISERTLSGEETTYRFAGTIISRSAEEATVLTQAEISNASNPEALWSLNASKLWLLPGSDFAMLNGVLKVGEIPVLYIPFFFFPADEIIFHPVLGYRSREGSFFQTTTYILGRPQSSTTSESSLSKILGNSTDMEKTQHG